MHTFLQIRHVKEILRTGFSFLMSFFFFPFADFVKQFINIYLIDLKKNNLSNVREGGLHFSEMETS